MQSTNHRDCAGRARFEKGPSFVLSADGNTRTRSVTGTVGQSQNVNIALVYDEQQGCGTANEGGQKGNSMSQASPATKTEKIIKEFVVAYNAGDASALGNLFTSDGVLVPPDGANMIGPEGVRTFYQSWFDQYIGELTVALEESQTLGDWTFGRGTFSAKLTPKAGGDPLQLDGKWLNVNAMQPDGSLKIARHIWNLPLGLMPTEA